jgi:2-polyprenyl-6-methoxyphenol hydroxylase-like FAD-dependent oxidoreductase
MRNKQVMTSAQQNENGSTARGRHATVLIAGAGFAGLAAAYWMNRLGYQVTLVELAKTLKKGGTPVDIREGVVDVVRRMGLLDRIAAQSLKARPMQFLDAQGTPVAFMGSKDDDAQGSIEGYEIERNILLDMLFNEVKSDVECIFGDSISGLEQSAEEVAVTFASGEQRSFSLVLGCDGTHSALRRMCFGEESSYSLFMQSYFSLTIVDTLLIAEDTAQMFNVPGKTVMLSAYNNKTDIAFCFSSEKEISYDRRNQDEQRQMIRRHFEGEGWRVRELLEEMSRCEDFYFDKLCQIRMKSWASDRVALVGDAAYCPSPAAGMGGSMAILGAAALADALQKYPDDLRKAFQEYDESFRPIAEEIQANAIEFGLEMVMPGSDEAIQKRNMRLNPS